MIKGGEIIIEGGEEGEEGWGGERLLSIKGRSILSYPFEGIDEIQSKKGGREGVVIF